MKLVPKKWTLAERVRIARLRYEAALKQLSRLRGFDHWSFSHTVDAHRLHLIRLEKKLGTYDGRLDWPSYR